MAIVFVSPRKKQITFFAFIAGFFVLAIIIIALIIFLSKPTVVSEDQVFKKPNININLAVLDSPELAVLLPMGEIEYNFSYQAVAQGGKPAVGNISAVSADEAIAKLQAMNLSGIKVLEEQTGRDNPFNVYYAPQILKNNKK